MGGQTNQQQTGSQVYYDPEKQQYYTMNQPKETNPILSVFGALGRDNPFATNQDRTYIGQSLNGIVNADRFIPKTIAPNYPEMNQLFPALNAGLSQNLQQSLLAPTDNTQSSGAGRFLAPSTSSKGK